MGMAITRFEDCFEDSKAKDPERLISFRILAVVWQGVLSMMGFCSS